MGRSFLTAPEVGYDVRQATRVAVHPAYNASNSQNDIAGGHCAACPSSARAMANLGSIPGLPVLEHAPAPARSLLPSTGACLLALASHHLAITPPCGLKGKPYIAIQSRLPVSHAAQSSCSMRPPPRRLSPSPPRSPPLPGLMALRSWPLALAPHRKALCTCLTACST